MQGPKGAERGMAMPRCPSLLPWLALMLYVSGASARRPYINNYGLLSPGKVAPVEGVEGSDASSGPSFGRRDGTRAPSRTARSEVENETRHLCAYRVLGDGEEGRLCFRYTQPDFRCPRNTCRRVSSPSGHLVANLLSNGSVLLQWTYPVGRNEKESDTLGGKAEVPGTTEETAGEDGTKDLDSVPKNTKSRHGEGQEGFRSGYLESQGSIKNGHQEDVRSGHQEPQKDVRGGYQAPQEGIKSELQEAQKGIKSRLQEPQMGIRGRYQESLGSFKEGYQEPQKDIRSGRQEPQEGIKSGHQEPQKDTRNGHQEPQKDVRGEYQEPQGDFGGRYQEPQGGFRMSCWWNGSYTQFECPGIHLASGCRDYLLTSLHENVPYRICLQPVSPAADWDAARSCLDFSVAPTGMQDIVIAMTTVGGAICVMLVIICLLVAYITENIMSSSVQRTLTAQHSRRSHNTHL